MEKKSLTNFKKSTMIGICFAAFLIAFAAVPAQAQQITVNLNAPELVKGSTVYATVEIINVTDLDAGQFDLSFNSSVLEVVNVENGTIEGIKIPLQWHSIDTNTLRVIFNLEGVTGISGSGQIARIGFEVIDEGEGDLLISNGLLGNIEANQINTNWGVTTATDVPGSTPGFGAVIALVGLIAVFCMVRFSKR
ncbi:MAG TPA: PGF-CTERM sorting domain-containing protein [Methanosarcinaceae archaeon]|nr:PGF-CTERM sorting domain-containing protein [Methanosarcinaceae archaeon]